MVIALLVALLAQADDPAWRRLAREHCVGCHGADEPKGGLNLEGVLGADPAAHPAAWEKVVRRLRTRQMPPPGKARPTEEDYRTALEGLEAKLDALTPDPGRTDGLRRLTRAEYRRAVKDLLDLDIDPAALLPADESSHGFDSAPAGTLSAGALDRYLSAAERVARMALGHSGRSPGGETFRVKPDVTQDGHLDGFPLGTRGGLKIVYPFPADGEYDLRIRLSRDRNEEVEGLRGTHEVVILIDRAVVKQFTVRGAVKNDHATVDAHLRARLPVKAGPRELVVTFLKKPRGEPETLRQPYVSAVNAHRSPRQAPAIFEVALVGPYDATGPGDTPSRRRVLAAPDESFLAPLLRRAFRRPVDPADLERFTALYRRAGDHESAVETTLSAILASSGFLFRVERDPEGVKGAYALSDLELATRLSFFLHGSLPDDALLAAAERGELTKPGGLEREARRLLADPRAAAVLSQSFAAQWLQIRNLEGALPDARLYPDFDDNLRQSMRRETELLFEELVREDRPVTALLRSDHTWLNERLARHYGIPHVLGDRFRRVETSDRGGLLRNASVLTVTSYANRTSPVLRGKWILDTLLGTPPPPPPPDVPALKEDPISDKLPVRERLRQHRQNPACASCHRVIDPPGFGLEGFDALGRVRRLEAGVPVETAGSLPDGSDFKGVEGLEAALLKRPELFAEALAEKLLVYALGRATGPADGPALREIVRKAAPTAYSFSGIVIGVVNSVPFRMRRTP
jgi:hypothetical protein